MNASNALPPKIKPTSGTKTARAVCVLVWVIAVSLFELARLQG
jgi:hypothetical protein